MGASRSRPMARPSCSRGCRTTGRRPRRCARIARARAGRSAPRSTGCRWTATSSCGRRTARSTATPPARRASWAAPRSRPRPARSSPRRCASGPSRSRLPWSPTHGGSSGSSSRATRSGRNGSARSRRACARASARARPPPSRPRSRPGASCARRSCPWCRRSCRCSSPRSPRSPSPAGARGATPMPVARPWRWRCSSRSPPTPARQVPCPSRTTATRRASPGWRRSPRPCCCCPRARRPRATTPSRRG